MAHTSHPCCLSQEKTELSKFKAGKMVASDDTVVVWIDQTFTVKATGRPR